MGNQCAIQFVDLPVALAQARAGGRRKGKREGQEGQAYSSSSANPPGLNLEGDGKQWETNAPFNLSISLLPWPKEQPGVFCMTGAMAAERWTN